MEQPQSESDSFGAEPLTGSGFEEEQPESEFHVESNADAEPEQEGRQ
jgi:hypothetical protein